MSYLAWIDFDPDERAKAQSLINLFKQPEARDELGIGAIRDGLADLLFPGTSTIQTRLRYKLFIPWVYREAQKRKGSQAERIRYAKELEYELSIALQNGGEREDVIGRVAGKDLKRLASSVYWAGLHILGIRLELGSPESFLAYGPESLNDHDLNQWVGSLPDRPDNLFESASFQLRHEEAEFLRDRITGKQKQSLFNELVGSKQVFDDEARFPWEIELETFSSRNQTILQHAKRFSVLMHGASLLYNLLLANRAQENSNAKCHENASELIEDYQDRLLVWGESLDALELENWDLNELFQLVGSTTHKPTDATRTFVRSWLQFAKYKPKVMAGDDGAVELLRVRERLLKKGKSRLHNNAPLERWSGASGLIPLDYRWKITKRYLRDLSEAKDA